MKSQMVCPEPLLMVALPLNKPLAFRALSLERLNGYPARFIFHLVDNDKPVYATHDITHEFSSTFDIDSFIPTLLYSIEGTITITEVEPTARFALLVKCDMNVSDKELARLKEQLKPRFSPLKRPRCYMERLPGYTHPTWMRAAIHNMVEATLTAQRYPYILEILEPVFGSNVRHVRDIRGREFEWMVEALAELTYRLPPMVNKSFENSIYHYNTRRFGKRRIGTTRDVGPYTQPPN